MKKINKIMLELTAAAFLFSTVCATPGMASNSREDDDAQRREEIKTLMARLHDEEAKYGENSMEESQSNVKSIIAEMEGVNKRFKEKHAQQG